MTAIVARLAAVLMFAAAVVVAPPIHPVSDRPVGTTVRVADDAIPGSNPWE